VNRGEKGEGGKREARKRNRRAVDGSVTEKGGLETNQRSSLS